MSFARLDDEGNVRLLDDQTFSHANSLKSALEVFTEDLSAFSGVCEIFNHSSSVISKTLLSLKASAALKRSDLNKEVNRREDLNQALQDELKYLTEGLRKDRTYLQSLKSVHERLVAMQENLFLK